MKYYAKINKEKDHYFVSFPDFPNINTYGDSVEDALSNAHEALNGCLESDFARGFEAPECKVYSGKNYHAVKVLPHIEIAIRLRKLRAGRSQIDVARNLGISYQAYQKMENPVKCNPTVKTLEKLAKVFDKDLEIVLS